MAGEDFERLQLLFRRTCTLPQLPGTALLLINVIDGGEASAVDIERIILSDPVLAAGFLRAAASSAQAENEHMSSTIRQAILFMGQRAVRSLAMSLALQGLLSTSDGSVPFNRKRFSQHSIFVGFLSRYVYARRQMTHPFASSWSADEIFAAGVLHDLGIGLLPRVAPEVFKRVVNYACRAGMSLNDAFEKIYGGHLSVLSASAAETWQLPDVFTMTLRHRAEPWNYMDEYAALCCIDYANYLADLHGYSMTDWPIEVGTSPEVELEVGLPEEEIPMVIELVAELTAQHLPENLLAA